MNLARIKFFGLFICALFKVQTVCFEKLAIGYDCPAKVDSSLRRIQRFMAEYILDTRHIRYHIRIRENFWVVIPRNRHHVKASWLFNHLKIIQYEFYRGIVYVNGQFCYLSASKIKNKQGAPELQIIVSFNKPDESQSLYKERWQTESAFKALKTSGFNIEDTHLTDLDRINKLLALVLFAFTWAYLAGIFLDLLVPIKIKKHGRRAKSLFKYGLTYLASVLFSNDIDKYKDVCKFLSCT